MQLIYFKHYYSYITTLDNIKLFFEKYILYYKTINLNYHSKKYENKNNLCFHFYFSFLNIKFNKN